MTLPSVQLPGSFRQETNLILGVAITALRRVWRQLLLADILFKAISFVVLVPLTIGFLHGILWLTGRGTLTDTDVLFFLLTPGGAVGMCLVGAVWLSITALEQATLLTLLVAGEDERGGVWAATRWAFLNSLRVIQVMFRVICWVVLVSAPVVFCAVLVAKRLLGKHDINFYLAERPPELFVAIGVGGLLAVGLAALLLRLFSGWFLALPLLVFEGVSPRDSLATSWKRLAGRHWIVVTLLGTWVAVVCVIATISTTCVVFVASEFVPLASQTLAGAIFAVGLTTLVWAGSNFIIQLVSAAVLSSLLYSVWKTFDGRVGSVDGLNFESSAGGQLGFRWSARTLTLVTCACVAVAVLIGSVATARIPFDNSVDIIGHRGAGGVAPENTRTAIERAISAGAQWVEIDVQETADGEVVVIHDSDLMKIAGVDLKVWDATVDEITAVDVGSSFDPKFHDERVPTLREILNLCKGRIGIIIELKSYGHGHMLEQRVVDLVEAAGSVDEVQCMSLKASVVAQLKKLRPNWRVGLLLSLAVGDLRSIEADFLAVNARFATSRMVQEAHEAHKLLYAWTLNDPVSISRMVGRGVDGVITDYPDMAKSVLVQRAELSVVQRLLLEFSETLGVQPKIGQQ